MALKIKGNPINIVPFIDVLLVLFVIMIVAARFDGADKVELEKLNALIESQKSQISFLTKKEVTKTPSLVAVKKVVVATLDNKADEIKSLNEKISKLEVALKAKPKIQKAETSGGGRAAIITFSDSGVTVNDEKVSEDFVKTLLKVTGQNIDLGYKGGEEAIAATARMRKWAEGQGYSFK